MNLSEAILAVWVMAVAITLGFSISEMALQIVQRAERQSVTAVIAQGGLEMTARDLGRGVRPELSWTLRANGEDYLVRTDFWREAHNLALVEVAVYSAAAAPTEMETLEYTQLVP